MTSAQAGALFASIKKTACIIAAVAGFSSDGRGTANDRYGEQECIALTKDTIKSTYPCFVIAPQRPTAAQWVGERK
jgi:hypothetical protein